MHAEFREEDLPTRLWPPATPLVVNLIASLFFFCAGAGLFVFGYTSWRSEGGGQWWWLIIIGLLIFVVAIPILIGCFRVGVRLTAREAVVIGYFGNTHIDRTLITVVTRLTNDAYPSIAWVDDSGRSRTKTLWAFSPARTSQVKASILKKISGRVDYIADWAKAGNNPYSKMAALSSPGAMPTAETTTKLGQDNADPLRQWDL